MHAPKTRHTTQTYIGCDATDKKLPCVLYATDAIGFSFKLANIAQL